ncbi:MAG TPA: hypothetical protein VHE13_03690 [Opitutus sp.]|nr:hypothetical protein [Opitutus sp.]
MKTTHLPKIATALVCLGLVPLASASSDRDSVVTAVFSRSFNNYARPVRADGSPELLTYVIAKGGYAPGDNKDESIDDVKFAGIVRVLGKYLAKQGYYPAKNGGKADLMLVVHWGKTVPFDHGTGQSITNIGLLGFEMLQQLGQGIGGAPGVGSTSNGLPPSAATFGSDQGPQIQAALQEAAQEQAVEGMFEIRFAQDARIAADTYNANLLGYTAELKRRDNPSLYGGAGTAYYDLLADIEAERYYVSVTAYDFQYMLQHNQQKGLWRTVASIDARDNRFDERLADMVDKASHYFGTDSGRLVRQFDYTPHVNLGELKVLGVVDDKARPDEKPASKK